MSERLIPPDREATVPPFRNLLNDALRRSPKICFLRALSVQRFFFLRIEGSQVQTIWVETA